jgi:energy-converting hydrogenase Eha subunit H
VGIAQVVECRGKEIPAVPVTAIAVAVRPLLVEPGLEVLDRRVDDRQRRRREVVDRRQAPVVRVVAVVDLLAAAGADAERERAARRRERSPDT